MKNSKLLIIMLLCMTSKMNAQTIGDPFYYIKNMSEQEGGEGEIISNWTSDTYLYKVVYEGGTFAYVFDNTDYCISTLIYPTNPTSLKSMMKEINENWVADDRDSTWRMDRIDGEVLHCELKTTDKNGYVFIIIKYKQFLQERESMRIVKETVRKN